MILTEALPSVDTTIEHVAIERSDEDVLYVTVTLDDIRYGVRRNAFLCPIIRGVLRVLDPRRLTAVMSSGCRITVAADGTLRVDYGRPYRCPEAAEWVPRLDGDESVEPERFAYRRC